MDADGVFKDLIEAEWDAYEHPSTRLLNLFFPIKGDGPEAHTARIKASCVRQLEIHKQAAPSSHWFKVFDAETGETVGGVQ